jgi:hypothetical protein
MRLVRKGGLVLEGRARSATAECLKPACRIERARASDMRKGGLEPLRSCDRQPLKLVELLCAPELTRIHLTDVAQERAGANASDDFIRTNSHTLLVRKKERAKTRTAGSMRADSRQ